MGIRETWLTFWKEMFFLSIDSTSGFLQMALKQESQNLTAFITPIELYKWKWLPMGLAITPGPFKNLEEFVLSGLSPEVALVYLDDINVFW